MTMLLLLQFIAGKGYSLTTALKQGDTSQSEVAPQQQFHSGQASAPRVLPLWEPVQTPFLCLSSGHTDFCAEYLRTRIKNVVSAVSYTFQAFSCYITNLNGKAHQGQEGLIETKCRSSFLLLSINSADKLVQTQYFFVTVDLLSLSTFHTLTRG